MIVEQRARVYGWDRLRECKPGDVMVEVRCLCSGAFVLPQFANRWSCGECKRPGVKTGRIVKVHGPIPGRPIHSGVSLAIVKKEG